MVSKEGFVRLESLKEHSTSTKNFIAVTFVGHARIPPQFPKISPSSRYVKC